MGRCKQYVGLQKQKHPRITLFPQQRLQVLCCFSRQVYHRRDFETLYYRRNTNIYTAQLKEKASDLFRSCAAVLLCILTISTCHTLAKFTEWIALCKLFIFRKMNWKCHARMYKCAPTSKAPIWGSKAMSCLLDNFKDTWWKRLISGTRLNLVQSNTVETNIAEV